MAVRIRLKRLGKIRNPQYRIVIADARSKRDGRVIEEVGKYHPKEDPSFIEVNSERVQYWLTVGAQPSEPVQVILSRTGDWQKFKGLPAPEPLKVAAPRQDRQALYEAEAKAAGGLTEGKPEARTEKKKPAKKAEAKADTGKADAAKADTAKADAAKADAEKTEGKPGTDAGAES
ncbi:MAG: 30S ribosomal protein S16 [Actinocatenispora sp.]